MPHAPMNPPASSSPCPPPPPSSPPSSQSRNSATQYPRSQSTSVQTMPSQFSGMFPPALPTLRSNVASVLPSPAPIDELNGKTAVQSRRTYRFKQVITPENNQEATESTRGPMREPLSNSESWPSFKSTFCLSQIAKWEKKHVQRGPQSWQSARLLWLLKGACQPNGLDGTVIDPLYLVIHRIICLSITRRDDIPTDLLADTHFNLAISLLSDMIAQRRDIWKPLCERFAAFPTDDSLSSPFNSQFLDQVRTIMQQFAQNYQHIERSCVQRQLPPTAHEIASYLVDNSGILQWLTFMFIYDLHFRPKLPPQAFDLANAAFKQSQQEYLDFRKFSSQTPSLPLPAPAQVVYSCLIPNVSYQAGRSYAPISTQPIPILRTIPTHVPGLLPVQQSVAASSGCATPKKSSQSLSTNPASAPGIPNYPRVRMEYEVARRTAAETLVHRPLLPPKGKKGPLLANPDPQIYGLHQAHLRSPILAPASPVQPSGSPQPRRYQYVSNIFRIIDKSITIDTRIEECRFSFPQESYDLMPQSTLDGNGTATRILDDGSTTYRLRCVKGESVTCEDSKWVVKDTSWPRHVYFSLNGHRLEPRRKLHYGKDLPIDITSSIQAGENVLRVVSNMSPDSPESEIYAVAIEVVSIIRHQDIHQLCRANAMPDDHDDDNNDDDDDEIIIASTKVALADPITGTGIPATPVRGRQCKHRACFDLDSFLTTRTPVVDDRTPTPPLPFAFGVGNGREFLSVVDTWKCPLCSGDARPNALKSDTFMETVKRDLEAKGLLDTVKAVVIDADGSWRPVVEEVETRDVKDKL